MTIKEELEKYGFNTFEHANKKFNELKEQFMEMSQLKSNFDIEKFTIRKEGEFIAHNFHFLMRQYSLALSELRRFLIEKEEIERTILENKEKGKEKIIVYEGENKKEKYADLYIKQLINQLDIIELNIVNKTMMVRSFEACRLRLIEMNDNKVPTNEQYQKEVPLYWKWYLTNKAKEQLSQRNTGISEGIWENIRFLEEKSIINPEFQVKMLDKNGNLNLDYKKKENNELEFK